MNIIELIPDHLLMLIPSIYVLGLFLKAIESIKDKYIVIILFAFAIGYSVVLGSFKDIPNSILHGILSWGVAVGINQVPKQLLKEGE